MPVRVEGRPLPHENAAARVNVPRSWRRRSRRLCLLMLGGRSACRIRHLDRRRRRLPSRRKPSPTPIPITRPRRQRTTTRSRPRPCWPRRGPSPARADGRGRCRGGQPLRRRLLLLAAAFYAFGLLCGLGALLHGGARHVRLLRGHAARRCPTSPRYDEVAATTTVVRGWDGTPLAELATERREILPFERVPAPAGAGVPGRRGPPVLRAQRPRLPRHRARAARQPARRRGGAGRLDHHPAGGASRSSIVRADASSARSARRSWPAASRRATPSATSSPSTSTRSSSGHGAYGVAAAARRYFDKAVGELDLGEMATIAGMARRPVAVLAAHQPGGGARPPRPGAGGDGRRRLPHRRRGQPLARPPGRACASRPTSSASARPTSPSTCGATSRSRYGDKKLLEGGLEIETTVVPWIDVAAQENVDFSLRKLDKRQGWRGPVARLAGAGRRRVPAARRPSATAPSRPVEGRLYLGLVESTTADGRGARARGQEASTTCRSAAMTGRSPSASRTRTNGQAAGIDRRRAARAATSSG